MEKADPHDLQSRFVRTHLSHYRSALSEIQSGHKSSCWMWYIFPTPPWIVDGVERGSWTNQEYSLRTDEQARAYLRYNSNGVNLRNAYFEITKAARDQLKNGNDVFRLFGGLDAPKFKSSIAYFLKMAKDVEDKELEDVCQEVTSLLELERNVTKKMTWGRSPAPKSSSSSSSEEEQGQEVPSCDSQSAESEDDKSLETKKANQVLEDKSD